MATFTFLNRTYPIDQYVVSTRGQRSRVILRTGRTCIDALRSGWHIEVERDIPYLRPGDRVANDYIRNPLTHRMIVVGGRIYRNLIGAGWLHAGAGGGLVQPDGYHTLTLAGNHREMEAQLLSLTTLLPFVFLLRLADGEIVRIRNYPPELKDVIGARAELEEEYDLPERGYERLANRENIFEGYILVTPTNVVANAQFLAASNFDGSCVREALQRLRPDRDWSDVPDHCGPKEMVEICRRHRSIIRIFSAINLEEPMYEWGVIGRDTHAHRPVYNLFYASHHCSPLHRVPIEFPSPADPNAPITWHDTADEAMDAMNNASEPTMPVVVIAKDNPEFLGFSTLTHHHKTRFTGHERAPLAWSDRGAARHIFMESNGGKPNVQTRMVPYLRSIVNPGITFMRTITTLTIVCYYDMMRAYASYAKCPYYTGFPDPNGILDVVSYDQSLLDPSSNLEGVVWVETDRAYPDTCFEHHHMWATFPQVRLAIDRNEPFVARKMIITRRADGDPYAHLRQALGSSNKKVFNRLVGRQHMKRTTPTAVARSVDELERLEAEGFLPLKVLEHNGRRMWICGDLRNPQDKVPEYALVAAYVHQYQKITLFTDLISKVPWEDVVRIWIDGVCLRKPLPGGFLPSARWHQEKITREYINEIECSSLHKSPPNLTDDIDPHSYNPFYHEKRIVIQGPPGSGKTYLINHFWLAGGRDAMLTASTNIAALNTSVNAMTVHKFLALDKSDPKLLRSLMRGKDRIIVDEYTMISKKLIEEVLALGYPVLLCGDPKQLCDRDCPTTQWLKEHGFVIHELTEIKRTSDPETKQMYEECRHLDDQAIIRRLCHKFVDGITYPQAFQRSHYIASTNEVVNRTNTAYANTFNGPEVTWGHKTKTRDWRNRERKLDLDRRIRAKVAVGMLVIGIKNGKEFKNQEISYITSVLSDNRVRVRSTIPQRIAETEVDLRNLNPGFAITFHRCQGQTFDFPIYVNTSRLFEDNMLYTAITRVTHHKHLNLIDGECH